MKLRFLTAIIAIAFTSGCATVNSMAFDKNAQSVELGKKSVMLMTFDVSRSDGSRHTPTPIVVNVERPNAATQAERQNFKIGAADAITIDGHTIYFARMALEPGEWVVRGVTGQANAFPFVAMWFVPVHTAITVKPGTIAYLGRVTAALRKRTGEEFRAGPVIPLIDQSVAGLSDGSWDVTIDDRGEKDETLFRSTYAALAKAPIEAAVMPPFNREIAQRWWATDGRDHAAVTRAVPAAVAELPPATATAPEPVTPAVPAASEPAAPSPDAGAASTSN
jgi:hypothetical protein